MLGLVFATGVVGVLVVVVLVLGAAWLIRHF